MSSVSGNIESHEKSVLNITELANNIDGRYDDIIEDAFEKFVELNDSLNAIFKEQENLYPVSQEALNSFRSEFSIYNKVISLIMKKKEDAKALFFRGLEEKITAVDHKKVNPNLNQMISLL